jgi:hypothetical protein
MRSLAQQLFWANRACDILFLCDLALQFNVAYYDPVLVRMQTSRKAIGARYLRTSAPMDALSTVPFDLVAALVARTQPGGGGASGPTLRALRALRLAKLLRLVRTTRIMARLEDAFHVQSGVLRLWRFAVGSILVAHWLACGLHMVAQFEGASCNWISALFAIQRGDAPCGGPPPEPEELPTVGTVYLAALVWSLQTATTVGYGDVSAQTDAERCFVAFAMLVGGAFFSYVVGSFVSVLATLNERDAATSAVMDSVNQFITLADLPTELANRLRTYFRFQHQALAALGSWRPLLDTMSPQLRGDVALALHAGWLSRLPLFSRAPQSLLIELSFAFRLMSFPPGELLACLGDDACRGNLLVVTRGAVAVRSPHRATERIRFAGLVVAEEALWPTPRITATVVSLTAVDAQAIRVDALLSLMDGFPAFQQACRRTALCHWLRERLVEVVAGVRRVHTAMAAAAAAGREELSLSELVGAARFTPLGAAGGAAAVSVRLHRDSAGSEREEAAAEDARERASETLALFIVSRAARRTYEHADAAAQRLQRTWRGYRARALLRAALSGCTHPKGGAAALRARIGRDAAARRSRAVAAAVLSTIHTMSANAAYLT